MPFGIVVDVGAVIVEEVALNFGLAGLVEKIIFVGIEIRVMPFDVGIVAYVARARRLQGEQICAKRGFVGGAIGPKGAAGFPIRAEAFVVGDRVLDDERCNALGMCEDHAKTYRAAIILHVQRIAREAERFGEVIHDFGDVIESVGEFFRVGPVAVAEAGVVGRDKVIAIGEPGEKRLEHA